MTSLLYKYYRKTKIIIELEIILNITVWCAKRAHCEAKEEVTVQWLDQMVEMWNWPFGNCPLFDLEGTTLQYNQQSENP